MAVYYWVGGSGTWDGTTTTNWASISGGSGGAGVPTSADTVNFDSGSGTAAVVTVAATAVGGVVTVDKSDINLSLSGSPTLAADVSYGLTLTQGTLTLNTYTLTVTVFNSSNANTRTIAFGTGQITCTGTNGWFTGTTTNMVVTGTPVVNLTSTNPLCSTGTLSEANSISFKISNYTGSSLFFPGTGGGTFRSVDFTGSTGTWSSFNGINGNVMCYGSVTLGSGMTTSTQTASLIFAGVGSSTDTNITTNGVTINFPIIVNNNTGNASSGRLVTVGALTSTSTLTVSGTSRLNFGSGTVTFASVTLSTTNLLAWEGAVVITGSGTVWNQTAYSGVTGTLGVPTVSFTSTSPKTAIFPNSGYLLGPKLQQSGAGALTFNTTTGTGTFKTVSGITNTVSPATILCTAGITVIADIILNGTPGNLVTLSSTTTSTFTLTGNTSGVNTSTYCSVSYVNATTSAGTVLWRFLNSTNAGNNTNLTFASRYYWVGGSGTWDGSTTTKWSLTSGGSGSAGVPTSADDVYFDTGSNATAYTVTMGTGAVCYNMSMSGPTTGQVTWAGSTAMSIYGSMYLSGTAANGGVNKTYSVTSPGITFASTYLGNTITTNGVSFFSPGVHVTLGSAAGGGWTLGSAFTGSYISHVYGIFNTAGYAVSSLQYFSSNANIRTLTLGATTWTCSGASGAMWFADSSITLNAGTSTINIAGSGNNLSFGNLTYYNVVLNYDNNSNAPMSISDSGTNTFNTLTFNASASAPSFTELALSGNITTTTLSLNYGGSSQTSRLFIRSNVVGTPRSISTAGYTSPAHCDFRDITASSANFTSLNPSTVGDCGGNSGLSFAAGKTVYWKLAGTSLWSDTGWATSSGGSPAAANFPLAQDTAVFDNNSGAAGLQINLLLPWNIGSVDTSTRTTSATLTQANSGSITVYGNMTLSSSTTWNTGGFSVLLASRGTQTINQNSATITYMAIQMIGVGGTVRLEQALTIPSTCYLQAGTLDLNGYTFTCSSISENSSSSTRAIAFNAGNIALTGSSTAILQLGVSSNFSYTGTSAINCTYSGSSGTRTINTSTGGGTEATALNINITAGSDTVQLAGGAGQAYKNINFTGFSGTIPAGNAIWVYGSLTLSTGLSISTGFSQVTFTGTSGTKNITTAGKAITWPVVFDGAGSTWQFQDGITLNNTATLTNGTLNLNGQIMVVASSLTTAAGTKNITFNGGIIQCTSSGTVFNNAAPTGFTTTRGTADGKITFSANLLAKTMIGGGSIYNCIIEQDGSGSLLITGSNTLQDLQATAAGYGQLYFDNGSTTTFYFFTLGQNNTGLKYVGAASATCTFTKQAGVVATDYIAPSFIAATGGATWYAGTHSSNGGGNSGWIFTDPPSLAGSRGMVTNFFLN